MNGNEALQSLRDVKACLDGLLPQAEEAWVGDGPKMLTAECYQNLMLYTGRMIAALGEVKVVGPAPE